MEHAEQTRYAKHVAHVRAAKIALALLAALIAGTAVGQGAGQGGGAARSGQAAQAAPPPGMAGPSYGPVLYPPSTKSEPGAQPEQTPQAQEERAGALPQPRHQEVDPSARSAPQQKDPARAGERKDDGNGKAAQKGAQKNAGKAPRRRAVQQRIETTAPGEPGMRSPPPPPPPLLPPQPVAVVPGPVRVNACQGGVCTDTNGAVYQTGVGNAAVNSAGRLCTRSGDTMQCF